MFCLGVASEFYLAHLTSKENVIVDIVPTGHWESMVERCGYALQMVTELGSRLRENKDSLKYIQSMQPLDGVYREHPGVRRMAMSPPAWPPTPLKV